jgi:LPS-assembly lipoprotein
MMVWIMAAALLLQGCGFHLRGTVSGSLDGHAIVISAEQPYSRLTAATGRRLRQMGGTLAATPDDQAMVLELGTITEDERTVSVDINGRPLEYELTLRVPVRLTDPQGNAAAETATARRILIRDTEQPIAREREKDEVREEMMDELARVIAEMVRVHAT